LGLKTDEGHARDHSARSLSMRPFRPLVDHRKWLSKHRAPAYGAVLTCRSSHQPPATATDSAGDLCPWNGARAKGLRQCTATAPGITMPTGSHRFKPTADLFGGAHLGRRPGPIR